MSPHDVHTPRKIERSNVSKPEVLINARFFSQLTTGVQRYASELVTALDELAGRKSADREGLSLTLLTPKNVGKPRPGLRHISRRSVGRLGGNAWTQLELPIHARGRVLWSPTNTGPVFHDRHVVTIHDASILDHPEWFSAHFARWYGFLLPELAKRAARLLTVSEFSRQRLIETLSVEPRKVSVVPCGIDGRFSPSPPEVIERTRKKMGLPHSYVLTLGSLEPRKNTAGLLEAWDLLLKRRIVPPQTHLVIAGGRSSLFREIGLSSLPDRVSLTGYVADEDLPPLYSGALAFVYPSFYEGFGLPPLEAMACGVPVVSSNSTSIPEVTGEAAVLVDPRDTESIARGIHSVLDDASLQETMRTSGLERARAFDWVKSARMVWEHLGDVAREDS